MTLLLEQPRSAHARGAVAEDGEMMVWWGSAVECASAIARLHRDGQLSAPDERVARAMLAELSTTWYEIQSGSAVRDQAMRVFRIHPLRAADALQLAAALEWSGGGASGTFIIRSDHRVRVHALLSDRGHRSGTLTPCRR